MVEVIMPKMGDAMEEGTLVEWLKKDGEVVESGDPIANIETDKAVVELSAPGSGILSGLLIGEGDTVAIGVPIAVLLEEGESLPEGWAKPDGAAAGPREKQLETGAAAKPAAEVESPAAPALVPVAKASTPAPSEGRILASPLARRLAQEAGIPMQGIRGTGPGGRIVERDVRAAKKAPAAVPVVAPVAGLKDEIRPLNRLRRITAERTTQSKQEAPHYYVTVEVDLESLTGLREQMNEEDPEHRISINDFVVKACALALQEMPVVNSSFEGGKQHVFGSVNIGMAVAVPDGLTVPVIKNCESKALRQIAAETRDLAGRARENRLTPDELSGSTFAISNMGMYEVEQFTAIINPPNGAIVAVSSARRMPVVIEDDDGEEALQIRTRMKITGSFDHRVIDGAVGAEFMGVVRKYLEAPTRLLA
ncbi:MAG: 2-oxo acid dehydrogenase subunit E2 [Armatimonadetes bacterium]|nr:2-oxo acid dehydrogenase subunit E2 [Armatimonadota bacterium]